VIQQAVILCGGLGSRLGALTANMPKPLLPVAGVAFLERQIFEIKRHGIKRFLLLAAFMSKELEQFAAHTAQKLSVEITVSIEPQRAGTGGALWFARDALDDDFFLFNGDSWFDINLLDLGLLRVKYPQSLVAMALRQLDDASRYGIVELENNIVKLFGEATGKAGSTLVNGGVYAVSRKILDHITPNCSLENDVMKPLARLGMIAGKPYDCFFLDIGIPTDYSLAQFTIPAQQRRPAVFFDRDGVLNYDDVHVGQIERFRWKPDAIKAIKYVNDRGYFAFVVTNQAGVAKGHYTEENVKILHSYMQKELAFMGAHIDDFRYCPYHPNATVEHYKKASYWRKPKPGMLLDLMKNWKIDTARSIMVGDQQSDKTAGEVAGIMSYKIEPDVNLLEFIQHKL
jgi:D,D-heptose 1,7-bisphosphate phosphatase